MTKLNAKQVSNEANLLLEHLRCAKDSQAGEKMISAADAPSDEEVFAELVNELGSRERVEQVLNNLDEFALSMANVSKVEVGPHSVLQANATPDRVSVLWNSPRHRPHSGLRQEAQLEITPAKRMERAAALSELEAAATEELVMRAYDQIWVDGTLCKLLHAANTDCIYLQGQLSSKAKFVVFGGERWPLKLVEGEEVRYEIVGMCIGVMDDLIESHSTADNSAKTD